IHQDGMLKNRTTYEIMNPTDVGWEGTKLVAGKHSGRAGFRNALSEAGLKLTDEQIEAAYHRFLQLADRKKHVTSADLVALVSDSLESEGNVYELRQWKVDIASDEPASAEVVIGFGDKTIVGSAEGNGPVDAIFKAIEAATQKEPTLEYYNIEAVTPGEDAQGQAHVRIKVNNQIFTGHGLATDVVEASARAYIAALSRVELAQPSTVIAGSSTSRWT
ncbi:MAG: alpha-isopropylmalate synthase regulatory domain-containing protein, partial [Thermomicrobiales bacterium]